jgi:ribonuclease G
MKLRQLIINAITEEERLALIEDGRVVEIYIKEKQNTIFAGDIYRGRVRNVLPGLQAAFVDLGNGVNGYLHRNDIRSYIEAVQTNPKKKDASISSFIREGEEVIVQVIKEGNEHKAPKLSMNLEFKSSSLIYKPFETIICLSKKITNQKERTRLEQFAKDVLNHEGMIIRTEATHLANEELKKTFDRLKSLYRHVISSKTKAPKLLLRQDSFIEQVIHEISPQMIDEIIYDVSEIGTKLKNIFAKNHTIRFIHHMEKEDIFSFYNINEEIAKALKKIVWLNNGSFIVIEQTEAMTVIDVNTGKYLGKYTYRDTVLKTNKEAAKEIVRQIRLRNLSGIILIDFIDMANKHDQQEIVAAFKEELKKDRLYTKMIGFTDLNILQLTRKKVRKSLLELLTVPCHVCNGTGRVQSPEAIAFTLERTLWELQNRDVEAVWVEANPQVAALFEGEHRSHLQKLEQTFKMKIFIFAKEQVKHFNIRHYGNIQEVKQRIAYHQ